MAEGLKIGVVSCSGEECLGGTISRLATRKMLDEIRPDETVTICLPLFLAGGEEERGFAESYPTIAVDGCDKCCSKRAIEKFSGKVSDSLVVSDIIGKELAEAGALSTRELTDEHKDMVNTLAKEIRIKFDDVLNDCLKNPEKYNLKNDAGTGSGGCGCGCK